MKVKLKNVALALLLVSVLACATEPLSKPSGYVNIGVSFPQKGFSIKAMPLSTKKISIKISGEGLTEPIVKEIEKSESETTKTTMIEKIPTGEKTIDISAFDSQNRVVAKASKNTTIEGNKINKLEIELKELTQNLKVVLDNYPANGAKSFVEIKIKATNAETKKIEDKTIFKEFEGKEVTFEKLELQDQIEVKAGVFDSGSTPLSSVKAKVSIKDQDTLKLKLNPIIFNLEEEFDIDESLTFSLGAFTSIADNFIFKDLNNKVPKIDKVTVKLNGNEIPAPTDRSKPKCINLTDNIKVDVEASDPDNDKLSFFWANTRTKDNGGYRSRLLKERESTVTSLSRLKGNHALGFIVTDRKTFVGPRTLYFEARVICKE